LTCLIEGGDFGSSLRAMKADQSSLDLICSLIPALLIGRSGSQLRVAAVSANCPLNYEDAPTSDWDTIF
jgi:hypothetical protein